MLYFKGEGYKYTDKGKEVKSRDDIIKSGWKHNANIFKVNEILKKFSADELTTEEMLEYIIKDSINCMALKTPPPKTSDFGLSEADTKKFHRIRDIVGYNIITVMVLGCLISSIMETNIAGTVIFILLIYYFCWSIYFDKNKVYKAYNLKIVYYKKVLSLYRHEYNKLIEKEKEIQRRKKEEELRKREEERRRQAEEKKRQEFQRKQRLEYWRNLMHDPNVSNLEKGRIFEEAMSELFEKLGYKSDLTRATKDGGIDIVLYKDGKKYFVQCKFHKNHIGVEPVKQLWADKDVYNADKVIMLTYSGVSKDAKDYIDRINKSSTNGNLYVYFDIRNILNLYQKADKM